MIRLPFPGCAARIRLVASSPPAAGRGYAAHRLLGRLSLPRPVTIGLAAPFARPARAAGTLAAVGLGAIAVTFAVGLSSSLNMVADGLSHAKTEPVQVTLAGWGGGGQPPSPWRGRRPSRRRCGRSRERCTTPRRPMRGSASPGCPGKSE